MCPSTYSLRCLALTFVAFVVFSSSTTASVDQNGKGTVHGDLRTSTTEWPSLKLHFTLKRGSMQIHGQPAFDVYANPIVSKDGLSVTYDGYVDFTEDSTLTRYMLVNGIAYLETTTSETDQTQESSSTSSQCVESKALPPLNEMIPALNEAIAVRNATLDGTKINCTPGNLFHVTFRGLKLAVCSSGSTGLHVYGSDMEIDVKYLKKRVEITAPTVNASAASACEKVVSATAVTKTTIAFLTGDVIPESESRSLDFGSGIKLSATTCSCKSTPRPCLFIHGLGIDYAEAELQDSFSYYWGNLTDHAPCCTEFKYMIWNSIETGWNNDTQQQTMCDLAASVTESGARNEIADTIVVTHSMGGLMLAGAIATGKCTLANSSSWIATSPPMAGSMGSDYAQEACNGDHTVIMETIGNLTGQCPVRAATKSLVYEDAKLSSMGLNEGYEAAQEVYRTHVHAAMCSNSFSGLWSIYQPMYWLLGMAIPHKSDKNDGMVEFQSCAGGFPLEKFGHRYNDQFYVTHLNHADTTFYNGDGLFDSAKKPVKWFECVL